MVTDWLIKQREMVWESLSEATQQTLNRMDEEQKNEYLDNRSAARITPEQKMYAQQANIKPLDYLQYVAQAGPVPGHIPVSTPVAGSDQQRAQLLAANTGATMSADAIAQQRMQIALSRMTPQMREIARASGMTDQQYLELAKSHTPKLFDDLVDTPPATPESDSAPGLTPEQRQAAQIAGMSDEDYLRYSNRNMTFKRE